MEHDHKTVSFTYSAKQQEEIRQIYDRYAVKDEDKMEKLRRLDKIAIRTATAVALAIGVIGMLICGLGMCYFLLWTKFSVWGMVLAIPGALAMLAAYPLYNLVTAKCRKKLAPEILSLCNELMK